jgi:hypothetical protein
VLFRSTRQLARSPPTVRPAVTRRRTGESASGDASRWLGLLPGDRAIPERSHAAGRERRL